MSDLLIEALKAERDWHERQWDFALDDARECAHREEKGAERIAMDRANGHHHRLSAIDAVLAQATTPAQPERGGDEPSASAPKAHDAAEVVVPRRPSPAMLRAGARAVENNHINTARGVWSAMIQAAEQEARA